MARRRYRRGVSSISVSTSHCDLSLETGEEIEIDIEVECDVTPGEPEIRWGDNACPGCGPEVEIASAVDDSGRDWTDEILADRDWLASIEEKAVETFSEPDDDDGWRERRAW
jgi:hypothetical protein